MDETIKKIQAIAKEGLLRLQKEFPRIGDIRQIGLHIGVEMVKDPATKEPDYEAVKMIRKEGLKRGVIFGVAGVRKNLFKIKPPLIIKESEADEILDVLHKSLKDIFK